MTSGVSSTKIHTQCRHYMVRVVITNKLKSLFTLFVKGKNTHTPKQAIISGKMSSHLLDRPCILAQTKALMRWTSITNGINLID